MKSFWIVITCFLTSFSYTFGQDAATKKIQAGIIFGTSVNFQQLNTKRFEADGVGGDFTIGVDMNYGLSDAFAFYTGLEFDFSKFSYNTLEDQTTWYNFNDSEILGRSDNETGSDLFVLKHRQHNSIYLTIPTMIQFRTGFIGYFRYFGKFGLKNSFCLSNKMNDEGFLNPISTGNSELVQNNNMHSPSDLLFYKGSIGLSLGAEWNFIGSTVLSGEVGYYYGFTPVHYTFDNDNLSLQDASGFFSNSANQNQLNFKLAVLF
ncbi:MAG: hypothetical protein KA521_02655 [Crocinitomicaceae bacterium]|nr:hypothetical protein [Crocinitomicaceae bacterium]